MSDYPEGFSDEDVYEKFKTWVEVGVLQYVLPTEPLGESWVLGVDGQIVKLVGVDQAVAWLSGADAVTRLVARRKVGGYLS